MTTTASKPRPRSTVLEEHDMTATQRDDSLPSFDDGSSLT